MTTLSEQTEPDRDRHFSTLFARARQQVIEGPSGLREVRLAIDGPPLQARTHMLTTGPFAFIRGENVAVEDLVLRHEGNEPILALHTTLRGSAIAVYDDLEGSISHDIGNVQLFSSPTSRASVRLRAHVKNEAFRITIAASMIVALAERYSHVEPLAARVASGAAFCLPPVIVAPVHRVIDEVNEIMDSDHYGGVRPLLLESRALGWLAMAMATPAEPSPARLAPREVDRMHEARVLLLSRLASPPTLAEVASAIGTNEFALKRNFKMIFGQPVYAHLLAVRLAHASQLLRETTDSIKEIAGAVGYAHASHFSTAFRRAYGISPGRYRERNRIGP
jgi:AraC-like DNA-binding protein